MAEGYVNVKTLSEKDKQDMLMYLSNVMGDVMWDHGVVRKEAKEHVKSISLLVICSAILQGEIGDLTPNSFYLRYLQTIKDQIEGKVPPPKDDEEVEMSEDGEAGVSVEEDNVIKAPTTKRAKVVK